LSELGDALTEPGELILIGDVRCEHGHLKGSCTGGERFAAIACSLRDTCKARGEVPRRMYANAQNAGFGG
ncbi:MAG: hypothetical protein ABI728_11290, partial [Betaproteobacteria bacterium]